MYACYIVFNSKRGIGESLKSIVPFVEKVVMVDGAFRHYPHKHPFSTDNTHKIAKKICDEKLVWVGCPKKGAQAWPSQVQKRNEYLKHVPNGEWFLVIDSDVIIRGEIEREIEKVEQSNYLCVGIENVNEYPVWRGKGLIPKEEYDGLKWWTVTGPVARIYQKQRGTRYRRHHSTIYVGHRCISTIQYVLQDVTQYNKRSGRTWAEHTASVIYKLRRPEARWHGSLQLINRYCGGVMPSKEELNRITQQLQGET